MHETENLLLEFEHIPPRQMMSRKWRLILLLTSVGFMSYSIMIKREEYMLLQEYARNGGIEFPFARTLLSLLTLVVFLGLFLVFLTSFLPLDRHIYIEKFKTIGILFFFVIQLLMAINFTLTYLEVKEILAEYNHVYRLR